MRKDRQHFVLITPSGCILSLSLGVLVFAALFAIFTGIGARQEPKKESDGRAFLTIIPAPTVTPTLPIKTEAPRMTVQYISPEGFAIGAYVRVTKTQGAGLKIRPQPGRNSAPKFLSADGELFTIIDGPDERDGFVWWKIRSFDHQDQEGWAAGDYLELFAPAYDQQGAADLSPKH